MKESILVALSCSICGHLHVKTNTVDTGEGGSQSGQGGDWHGGPARRGEHSILAYGGRKTMRSTEDGCRREDSSWETMTGVLYRRQWSCAGAERGGRGQEDILTEARQSWNLKIICADNRVKYRIQ